MSYELCDGGPDTELNAAVKNITERFSLRLQSLPAEVRRGYHMAMNDLSASLYIDMVELVGTTNLAHAVRQLMIALEAVHIANHTVAGDPLCTVIDDEKGRALNTAAEMVLDRGCADEEFNIFLKNMMYLLRASSITAEINLDAPPEDQATTWEFNRRFGGANAIPQGLVN